MHEKHLAKNFVPFLLLVAFTLFDPQNGHGFIFPTSLYTYVPLDN